MSRTKCLWAVAAVAVFAGHEPVFAALEVGATPTPNPRVPRGPSPPQDQDATQAIRQGIVTATSAAGDRVEIGGVWHFIDAGRTRFFHAGRPTAADVVRKGQTLKFTIAGGQAGRITLGIVYVP